MRPYQAQLARVERFLNRISTPKTNRDEYEDFFWAFFQNCWHLRDWIKHDASISTTKRQSIARAVARSPVLKVCQCIANRSKHYKPTWKTFPHRKKSGKWRPRRTVRVEGEISIRIKGESATTSLSYRVKAKKKNDDALAVAREAVEAWRRILDKHHLS